jgi:hypothetical protein
MRRRLEPDRAARLVGARVVEQQQLDGGGLA